LTSDRLTAAGGLNNDTASTDLWSAAYREAVESLQKEIDIATLKGKDAAHLFEELEHVAKEATHKSFFVRGMRYLQTLQVPLERFKDALDLATPLANLEPTAGTVLGVVRGLTAVSPFDKALCLLNSLIVDQPNILTLILHRSLSALQMLIQISRTSLKVC
jgi:hypothetical protein